MKILSVLLILVFSCFNANAQFYKQHYIAPAKWQYLSKANVIVIATNSTTTAHIVLKQSDGTLITNLTAVKGSPAIYRPTADDATLASYNYSTVLSGKGLFVSADQTVSVNIRNIASDHAGCNDSYIKGNASLTSFGDAGIGTQFRLGYYRTGSGITNQFYSVMAIENQTTIKINGGATLATLNAGESYILNTTTAAMGDLLETNKGAVAISGAMLDAPAGCGDGVYDQIAPVSILGPDYYVVRGKGNTTAEQTTLVGTVFPTTVTVENFNLAGASLGTSTYSLTTGTKYVTIPNGDGSTAYSATRIHGTNPLATYSGTADGCEVDMSTLAPVSGCSGSQYVETSQFLDYNGNTIDYFAYVILHDATTKVYMNGTDLETLAGARRQLGSTGYYLIDFAKADIGSPTVIALSSTVNLTVSIVQQGAGYSMSAFFSSFSLRSDEPVSLMSGGSTCGAQSIELSTPAGFGPYQWYKDGVAIVGQTNNTYTATSTGSYTVGVTLSCGNFTQSLPLFLPFTCTDVQVTKTVDNSTPVVGTNVTFTVTARNNSGTTAATNVRVTDILPSGYTYVSDNPSVGYYDRVTGIWNIDNLAVSTSKTLTITATVLPSGTYANSATIRCEEFDTNSANNTSTSTPTPKPITSFTYSKSAYCQNENDPTPTLSANGVAGTFSATPGGLVFISTSTGQIDLSASTPGAYTVTNSVAASGSYAANSATTTVTVNASPSISAQPSPLAQNICLNGTATALSVTASAVSGTITKYEWFSNTSNSNSGGTSVAVHNVSAITDTYTPLTTSTSAKYYYVVVTNSGGCTFTSNVSGLVTINPVLSGNTSGSAVSICSNTNTTLTGGTVSGGSGTYTYLWESSNASGGTYGSAAGTNNQANYDTGTLTTASTLVWFRRTVTSGGCSSVAAPVKVTVNALPTITLSSTSVSVYYNESSQTVNLAYSATTQSPTTYSITWNSAPVNSFAAVTDAALPSSPVVITVPAATAENTYTGYLTVKNGNTCSSSSSTFTVTVIPDTDLSVTKTVDNSTPSVGSNVTFTITATNNGFSAATGVKVTEVLPAGYSYVSDNSGSTGTTYNSGTGIWTIGSMANGATKELKIVAKVL